MTKRLLWIVLVIALLPASLLAQGNNYLLEGKLGNWNKPAVLVIQHMVDGKSIDDTCDLKTGYFKISGKMDWPAQAFAVIYHEGRRSKILNQDVARFWLEPGSITINSPDSLKRMVITGSKLNDEQREIDAKIRLLKENNGSSADGSLTPDLPKTPEEITLEKKAVELRFIKSHPNSLVSLELLRVDYGVPKNRGIPDLTVVEPLFSSFTDFVKKSPEGQKYANLLKTWKMAGIGSIAPDFTQLDPDGHTVKLSDYKGKYVLVDFWASWCHPCRDENPNLVKQYNLYKAKNFTILSVSIDEIAKNWLNAVKEDKLPWKQVSDLKRPNKAYVTYGVEGIPENFLIAPDGKIIAKSLRGEDLNKKLKELLDK
jgi:peroxiredoxin